MKIALINGSPKVKRSGSDMILQGLKKYLDESESVLEFAFHSSKPDEAELEQIMGCDALVFAFPLYVDGIPSHLLASLIDLENSFHLAPPPQKKKVYAVVNCGFYEGEQADTALKQMQHWCARAGLSWGQGLGVGAGGMLTALKDVPMGHGPMKDLGKALNLLSQNISQSSQEKTAFVTMNFPRIAYKATAEQGWRKAVRKIGLTTQDLFAQPGRE